MTQDQRVFVCTNQKSGVGDDVAKALKKELKAQGLRKLVADGHKQRVRIQTCNCLDVCKSCKKGPGAALVVYPEGTLYGNVKPADAAELVEEHIGRGRPVKRLVVGK
jgi:(2Fe-2S) ferredoxin